MAQKPMLRCEVEDGSVKVFIVARAISGGGTHAQHAHAAPHAALGRHVKDKHAKDSAQDVAEDVA